MRPPRFDSMKQKKAERKLHQPSELAAAVAEQLRSAREEAVAMLPSGCRERRFAADVTVMWPAVAATEEVSGALTSLTLALELP